MKLFLKGSRCLTEKCPFERRPYPPGQHGQRARIAKTSEYYVQLREKQKVKRIYGVLERQFRNYFRKAAKSKGITGEVLLQLLERRLDNVVYRAGFASSLREARQWVRHGHFRVNSRKVDIPSFLVKEGDVIEVKEKSREMVRLNEALEKLESKVIPPWIEVEKENYKIKIVGLPSREDIPIPINENLIVELYSK